jgi:hypothetical protein
LIRPDIVRKIIPDDVLLAAVVIGNTALLPNTIGFIF